MPSKQTRRSISVRGTTYDALRGHADAAGRSLSDIVEELLAALLRGATAPTEKVERPRMVTVPARARPALANRLVRAASPAPRPAASAGARPFLPGRPAPTPAERVIGRRTDAPDGDYRKIRF